MRKNGFTLIELLVVVAIIAVLVAILLPGLSASREISKSLTCVNLLKHYGLANQYYVNEYNGYNVPIATPEWMTNQSFFSALSIQKTAFLMSGARWPRQYACPNATFSFIEAGLSYIPRSYGFNYTDSSLDKYPPDWTFVGFKQDQIISPSLKLQIADGLNWLIHRNHSNVYADMGFQDFNAQATGYVPIAYRHRKSAGIVFFDGHAASMIYTDVAFNRTLWDVLH